MEPASFVYEQPPVSMSRAVLAATVGNALEFYDFVTFAFFAIQIGKTFFPSGDPFVSLMGSLTTFGMGFVSRPLGAYVLGGYADRRGRKPAMLISMVLMGLGILLLVLTPGYATIGIVAPIMAVFARLIQGFALGGEVGAATTYMLEAVPEQLRGLSVSFQGVSQAVAVTMGSLVGLVLSLVLDADELARFGWRIALLLGATSVPFALAIRRSLPETHTANVQAPARAPAPSGQAQAVVLGLVLIGAGTIATYIFTYMATFGQNTLKLATSTAMAGQFANSAIQILVMLAGGWLSDRFGRKPLMIWPQLAFLLLVVPMFHWIVASQTASAFIVANVVLAACCFTTNGVCYALINESLPSAIRARGFALIYSLPVTFLGGTTQLVVTWLLKVTGDPMVVAWYLAGVSAIGLVAMMLVRETAPRRLTPQDGNRMAAR
jgi:MFS family permease